MLTKFLIQYGVATGVSISLFQDRTAAAYISRLTGGLPSHLTWRSYNDLRDDKVQVHYYDY